MGAFQSTSPHRIASLTWRYVVIYSTCPSARPLSLPVVATSHVARRLTCPPCSGLYPGVPSAEMTLPFHYTSYIWPMLACSRRVYGGADDLCMAPPHTGAAGCSSARLPFVGLHKRCLSLTVARFLVSDAGRAQAGTDIRRRVRRPAPRDVAGAAARCVTLTTDNCAGSMYNEDGEK